MATYDGAALSIMLSNVSPAERKRKLAALAKKAAEAVGVAEACPECDCTELEDNGCTGHELTYLCTGCGHTWCPAEEA